MPKYLWSRFLVLVLMQDGKSGWWLGDNGTPDAMKAHTRSSRGAMKFGEAVICIL